MLPEASFVFLDELLNANSAILNSLLMVLNERIFRRGRETIKLPLLMVVGASNRLPEDDALNALFDRFLLRVPCDNVAPEALAAVLTAGWRLDNTSDRPTGVVSVKEIRQLQRRIADVQLESVREPYVELVQRLRHAGIPISDRRAVRLQRVIAASALLCGRQEANRADFWVLRYIWNTEEQQPVLASLIQNALEKASENEMAVSHTRARQADEADPEQIGRGLSNIERQLNDGVEDTERVYLQDQVAILASRCEWVRNEQQREFLQQQVQQLWDKLGVNAK
jgi:MoxR-like ATPase